MAKATLRVSSEQSAAPVHLEPSRSWTAVLVEWQFPRFPCVFLPDRKGTSASGGYFPHERERVDHRIHHVSATGREWPACRPLRSRYGLPLPIVRVRIEGEWPVCR